MKTTSTIVRLGILETYKVRWNAMTVARDVVQNFFDEVDDFGRVVIDIDASAKRVTVSGPSEVAFDYLRYIGATTKAAVEKRTAGGFGEGFKICALVVSRDFGAQMEAGSRGFKLNVQFEPSKLGRELAYEITEVPETPGSFVTISQAPKRLLEAFGEVKDEFRHPANSRLCSPLFVDETKGVGVWYAARKGRADIFYRKQRRGIVKYGKGFGLTMAYDGRLDTAEGDRDRRDIRTLKPVLKAIVAALPSETLKTMVQYLKSYWQRGHQVLTLCVQELGRRKETMVFSPRWVANKRYGYVAEELQRLGLRSAIAVFAEVGMPTVEAVLAGNSTPRAPTPVEEARIAVARDFYISLTGHLPVREIRFVVDTADKTSRHGGTSRTAVVGANTLQADFAEGISECLRLFASSCYRSHHTADILTEMISAAMKLTNTDNWRSQWDHPDEVTLPTDELPEESIMELAELFGEGLRYYGLVWVYGPAGCPLLDDIVKKVKALARSLRMHVPVTIRDVHNTETAIRMGVTGLPAVSFQNRMLEKFPGKTPYYSVRPLGKYGLYPDWDLLKEKFAETKRSKRQYQFRSKKVVRPLGKFDPANKRQLAWLKKNKPEKWRRHRIDLLLTQLGDHQVWPQTVDGGLIQTAHKQIVGDLAHIEAELEQLIPKVAEALAVQQVRMAAVADQLRKEFNQEDVAIFYEKPAMQLARAEFVKQVAAGRGDTEAVAAAIRVGRTIEEFHKRRPEVQLDQQCLQRCVSHAQGRLENMLEANHNEAEAIEETLNIFADAVAALEARHSQRDERAQPYSCGPTSEVLDKLLGYNRPTPPPDPRKTAVAEAWNDAITAGATQEEAFAMCLKVAETFGEE